jgi:alpha-tubulin suppressor-like RCC1 family protein
MQAARPASLGAPGGDGCTDAFDRVVSPISGDAGGWGNGPLGAWAAVNSGSGTWEVDGARASFGAAGFSNTHASLDIRSHVGSEPRSWLEVLVKWRVESNPADNSWRVEAYLSDAPALANNWVGMAASGFADGAIVSAGYNYAQQSEWADSAPGYPPIMHHKDMWLRLLVDEYGVYTRLWEDGSPEPVAMGGQVPSAGGRGEHWHAYRIFGDRIPPMAWQYFELRPSNGSDVTFVDEVTFEVPCGSAITSCDEQTLRTLDVVNGPDERVTLLYDPRFLVDPTSSTAQEDARAIAVAVKDRAEAALDHYQTLGFDTPPNVTIEIRCKLRFEVLGDIPVAYLHHDPPGYTGDWDDIQLLSDTLRGEFATGGAVWPSLVDHEVFHTVEHWMVDAMGVKYLFSADTANMESAATLAQDLFADMDDNDNGVAGTYWATVLDYFRAEEPSPLAADALSEASYRLGAVLQYLGEQYGTREPATFEEKVATFLRRLLISDRTRLGAIEDAMLSEWDSISEALRDFVIAAYVGTRPHWSDYPAKYRIADEQFGYGGTGAGTDYPPYLAVTPATADNDLTFGGSLSLSHPLGIGEGYVFELNVAPNVLLATLSLTSWGASKSEVDAVPGVAVLPVAPDGSIEVMPEYLPRWLTRAEYQEPITVPVAGLSQLAVVIATTAPAAAYELTVTDASHSPGITIMPESQGPTPIGTAPFDPLAILVRPTTNNQPIRGLSARAFTVNMGDLDAEVRSASHLGDGRYRLIVQPPEALASGAHDLTVTLANLTTSPTAPGAIVVDGASGLSTSASGPGVTAFLDVENLGETRTPIRVRYALTNRAGPLVGAQVTAVVSDPNGTARSRPLIDDGGHGDGAPDDGVYGVAIWATDVVGDHAVAVTATGVDASGIPFDLQATGSASLAAHVDADSDGVPALVEPWFGLTDADPADAALDGDLDGLNMAAELAAGSNPFLADTDGGGEADGSELASGRDPLDASDDGPAATPLLAVHPSDAHRMEIYIGTEGGVGTVVLTRVGANGDEPIGTYPGAGQVVVDAPRSPGDYTYRAVGVGATGAESAPVAVGPTTSVADATPPDAFMIVNEGAWRSGNTTVPIQFTDLTEVPLEMRLADGRTGLDTAPWLPFSDSTAISLDPELGIHVVYAQLRDAAGNTSRTLTGVVDIVDETPPSSTAGPLPPSTELTELPVPFEASDDLSAVADVELWWRHRLTDTGSWSTWTLGPTSPTSPMVATLSAGPGLYEFYTVAIDGAGNREAAPSSADASLELIAASPTSSVSAWGRNFTGELGAPTTETCGPYDCSTQPLLVGGLPAIVDVAAASLHSAALAEDGTVWTWGDNQFGQLGVGGGPDAASPVQVSGVSQIIDLDANGYSTLALRADGTLWIWGQQSGGIGDGTAATQRSSPVQVVGLANVVDIDAGQEHSLALKADGTLWTWGLNNQGQLGNNSTSDSATPIQVLSGVAGMSGGGFHSLAVKTDGTVWVWGDNAAGQLGTGNTSQKRRPTKLSGLSNVTEVGTGWSHSFAITSDGGLWAWGKNDDGQVGDGQMTDRMSPFHLASLSSVVGVDGGYGHSVAITSDGTVWGWGAGNDGQLDSGSTTRRLTPTAVASSVSPASTVSAGNFHTLAASDTP